MSLNGNFDAMSLPARPTVLVNASAAKYGGAMTIVESMLNWIARSGQNLDVVLVVGAKPNNVPGNVQLVIRPTNGIGTLAFSLIGVRAYLKQYKPAVYVSLTNFSVLAGQVRRITYVQNDLLLRGQRMRAVLFRLLARVQGGVEFVVQSEYVADGLRAVVGNRPILSHWPGFEIPEPQPVSHVASLLEQCRNEKRRILVFPANDWRRPQKNFAFVRKYEALLRRLGYVLLVTGEGEDFSPTIRFIGRLSRAELFWLYQQCDFLLVTSTQETLALPIFEHLSIGGRALALSAPYLASHVERFNAIPGLTIFDTDSFEKALNTLPPVERAGVRDYSIGDWSFLIPETRRNKFSNSLEFQA